MAWCEDDLELCTGGRYEFTDLRPKIQELEENYADSHRQRLSDAAKMVSDFLFGEYFQGDRHDFRRDHRHLRPLVVCEATYVRLRKLIER